MQSQTLTVPSATLYHEVRGTGPVLLFVPGGNGDAGPYAWVAEALADGFTTVTYDRRGFSRSPLEQPPVDATRLETDVDDACRLLDHLGASAAHVFGSSSGAIVALDLLTRHPERVRTVVAHEPPSLTVLPDGDRYLDILDDVYEQFRREGAGPAFERFAAETGVRGGALPAGDEPPPPEMAEIAARLRPNIEFWFEHELRQYPRAPVDVAALHRQREHLVLAGGRDSRENFPYFPNAELARRLGTKVVDFPGGHVGYATDPAEFAAQLSGVLR
jgi:pimeloyl-ACP methyl ester carboxylesterase